MASVTNIKTNEIIVARGKIPKPRTKEKEQKPHCGVEMYQAFMTKKMKNKRIVLDCDDVLLDWSSGFRNYIERETSHRQQINESTEFTIGSQYNISVVDGLRFVNKFNTGIYFQLLDPCPGARKGVQWLLEDGYDIHIITACGTDPATQRMRLRNLAFAFGPRSFKEVIFVDGGHSKVDFLTQFPGCFFVDDAVHNVEAAKLNTDVYPILLENYMNRHLVWDGPRINSLCEFYDRHIAEKTSAA